MGSDSLCLVRVMTPLLKGHGTALTGEPAISILGVTGAVLEVRDMNSWSSSKLNRAEMAPNLSDLSSHFVV